MFVHGYQMWYCVMVSFFYHGYQMKRSVVVSCFTMVIRCSFLWRFPVCP